MSSMSPQEREDFLAMPHVGVLGVNHEGRAPLAVPIWYDYRQGGDVTILTGATSLKARLIRAAGRLSLCVQQESLPYRYVMVEGPVVDTREADIETDERPMAHRYLGRKMGDQYCEGLEDQERSIRFTMRPEHWYSVDYGRQG